MRCAGIAAVCLALAVPAPAFASQAGTFSPRNDPFPVVALAPFGFSAGYLLAGRPERALFVPLGIYVLTGAGGVFGFLNAWETSSRQRPAESLIGFFVGPLAGAAVGLGLGSGLALIDQATQAPPAGPWLAPLLSIGAISAIIGSGLMLEKLTEEPKSTSP